jgi:hypothetical protein
MAEIPSHVHTWETNEAGRAVYTADLRRVAGALTPHFAPVAAISRRARLPVLRVLRLLNSFGSSSTVERGLQQRGGKIVTLWRKRR